jgi:protein subunit release factor B
MLRFPVSTQKLADLNERMQRLALGEAEIEESFFKASSPGGQKANKTLSGVSLLHLPTQIRIRCQRERSQGINRFIARRLLVEELEARLRGLTRHSAKAERLHEEKERKNRSSRRQPSALGHSGSSGHAAVVPKPGVFDLARAMGAYYLRPLS